MDIASLFIYAAIAFSAATFSGMLGLGGAVVLIPAFLYLPSALGLDALDMRAVSGLTSVLVAGASLTGVLAHRRRGVVNPKLVTVMGATIAVTAFAGASFSGGVDNTALTGIFAAMALAAAALLLLPSRSDQNASVAWPVVFNVPAAIAIAASVGFLGGMVGAPGAFLLAPLMMVVLRIPTRVTIGSTLGIVLLSAAAASIGKFATGQVPLVPTLAAAAGSIPGVLLGASLSHRMRTATLRLVLAALIAGVSIRMWWGLLG